MEELSERLSDLPQVPNIYEAMPGLYLIQRVHQDTVELADVMQATSRRQSYPSPPKSRASHLQAERILVRMRRNSVLPSPGLGTKGLGPVTGVPAMPMQPPSAVPCCQEAVTGPRAIVRTMTCIENCASDAVSVPKASIRSVWHGVPSQVCFSGGGIRSAAFASGVIPHHGPYDIATVNSRIHSNAPACPSVPQCAPVCPSLSQCASACHSMPWCTPV